MAFAARRLNNLAFNCTLRIAPRTRSPRLRKPQLQRSFSIVPRRYIDVSSSSKNPPGLQEKVQSEPVAEAEVNNDGAQSEQLQTATITESVEDEPSEVATSVEVQVDGEGVEQVTAEEQSPLAIQELQGELTEGEDLSDPRQLEGAQLVEEVVEGHENGAQDEVLTQMDDDFSELSDSFWKYTAPGEGDQEFLKTNVSSLGHDELEQQREYREYARYVVWELPLLNKLTKPFTPPTKSQPLRFRYTSYLGESHPAAAKVSLEFSPSDLPDLTNAQCDKLIKLLGVRYNPSTGVARMSCESFPTQHKNKRYLKTKVDELLKEARDPTDTFEDVPFDFRHHKPKEQHEFPKEWIMTEERRAELSERWNGTLLLAKKREMQGGMVDGAEFVQRALAAPERTKLREPVMLVSRMQRPGPTRRFR